MASVVVPYESLDTKVHDVDDHIDIGGRFRVRFPDESAKIILEMGIEDHKEDGKIPRITITMPWGVTYGLGSTYTTAEEAKQAFDSYENTLRRGCTISLIDKNTIRLLT